MAWRIAGTYYSPCSCKVGCPCELGEMEADRGWCSGNLTFDIRSGNIDGIDVSGTKVAMDVDWPGGMLGGEWGGPVLLRPRRLREAAGGSGSRPQWKKGGVFEILSSLVPKALPSKEASIS